MTCRELEPWFQAYLDGELPVERTLELETHLRTCDECRLEKRVWQAVRAGLKRSVRSETEVRSEFREKLKGVFHQELMRERQQLGEPETQALARVQAPELQAGPPAAASHNKLTASLRNWAPGAVVGALAAAAIGMLLIERPTADAPGITTAQPAAESSRNGAEPRTEDPELATASESEELINDGLVDEFLRLHSMPPPPRMPGPGLLTRFERDVGVRVQLPPQWNARQHAFLQGASVRRVRRGQVAFLRYRTPDNHHVTLYVYDPARIPLHAALPPRVISPVPVYQVRRRGYSIAAMARQGVGYAIASDLDSEENLELIGTLY